MSTNSSPDKKLSARQARAVEALLAGRNYEQAAIAAGVHERTLYRWREEVPEFERELERRGRSALQDAARQLTGSLQDAVSFLQDAMRDTDMPPSVRVRAALGLIDRQIRLVEQAEIVKRLDALEERLNNAKRQH